jgi:hypothetical protein
MRAVHRTTPITLRDALALVEHQRMLIDQLRAALEQIESWSRAYPLDVFPEPDFKKAAELLAVGGITLDAICASNMRQPRV